MQLTETDKMFLSQLRAVSKTNMENKKKTIVTSMGLLSSELLNLFGVESNHQGAWFFNVYVEFEPMFKTQEAKDWQK